MTNEELADFLAAQVRRYVGERETAAAEALRREFIERVASLPPGEKGDPGERGEKGDPGEPGPAGPAGDPGERGEKGLDGKDGVDGKDGLDGKDGKDGIGEKGLDGKDGKDGRDGRDGKDGVASVDEIKAIAAEFVAAAVAVAVEKAVADAFAALPILTYKGVWREGTEYLPGHTATWAGSIWHCNAPTHEKPGNGNGDWTLAVKKGRDGSPTAHRA